jgi:MFS family permease
VPGFARLVAASTLAEIGAQMTAVVLVLFVLERFSSPQLAGVTLFLAIGPGLVISPIAGALLDRSGRLRLIAIDYAVGAVSMSLIGALALAGRLAPAALLVITAFASLSNPLSRSGTRSLFPLLVPRPLWDRANAVDSGRFVVSTVAGPALGGALVAATGGSIAVAATGGCFVAAAAALVGMEEPAPGKPRAGLLRDSLAGLVYVWRNRSLRGLAVTLSVFNMGFGILTISLPLLVLQRLHRGAALVGALWAALGVGGIVAGAIAGHLGSEGRERRLMAGASAASVAAMTLVAASSSLALVVAGMLLLGIANGPYDIGLFSLRQRRTPPAWLGRAFAVSMSLNFLGFPVGTAIGGVLVARSLDLALLVAVLTVVVATALPLTLIPAQPDPEATD